MDTDLFCRLKGDTRKPNLVESIRDSLQWLLNSRKGFLPHLPDYGIRDLADIRNVHPREELKQEIREAILNFEPRIKELQIEEVEIEKESLRHFYVVYRIQVVLHESVGDALTLMYGVGYDSMASPIEE